MSGWSRTSNMKHFGMFEELGSRLGRKTSQFRILGHTSELRSPIDAILCKYDQNCVIRMAHFWSSVRLSLVIDRLSWTKLRVLLRDLRVMKRKLQGAHNWRS